MTKRDLEAGQRRIVEIIELIGFGSIHGLLIREGQPCYDPAPRILQSIKLSAKQEHELARGNADTLKKEFESLFEHLSRLRHAIVDIEVQHGVPFRVIVERSC
jgi:hypothetical protein